MISSLPPPIALTLNQPVLIDNKPGASAMIAAAAVATVPADGYTLFGTDGAALTLNSALFKKLTYDPDQDFTPVSQVIRAPLMIVAHPGFPASDLKGLVSLARKEQLAYASPGKGSFHQLAMELLKHRAQFAASDVTYKGTAPGIQDVIAGQVPLMSSAAPPVGFERARALHSRILMLPEECTEGRFGLN